MVLRQARVSASTSPWTSRRCALWLERSFGVWAFRLHLTHDGADFVQMKAIGIQSKKLVDTDVSVDVDTVNSFMTHDKVVIIDNRLI